jgi:hypothetical protein
MNNHDLVHELTKIALHTALIEKAATGTSEQAVIVRQHAREVLYLLDVIGKKIQPELVN